jgi:hypothetical protein
LPPLLHVPVIFGMVTRVPGLVVGIKFLTTPVKLVGMVRDGRFTPTPPLTVTDAATVAERLTPIGLLGTSVVSPGKVESRDEAPSNTTAGT